MSKHGTITKLEGIIDSLTDSLVVVSHNEVETNYVLSLRNKYQEHYKRLSGNYYRNQEARLEMAKIPEYFELVNGGTIQ